MVYRPSSPVGAPSCVPATRTLRPTMMVAFVASVARPVIVPVPVCATATRLVASKPKRANAKRRRTLVEGLGEKRDQGRCTRIAFLQAGGHRLWNGGPNAFGD